MICVALRNNLPWAQIEDMPVKSLVAFVDRVEAQRAREIQETAWIYMTAAQGKVSDMKKRLKPYERQARRRVKKALTIEQLKAKGLVKEK